MADGVRMRLEIIEEASEKDIPRAAISFNGGSYRCVSMRLTALPGLRIYVNVRTYFR